MTPPPVQTTQPITVVPTNTATQPPVTGTTQPITVVPTNTGTATGTPTGVISPNQPTPQAPSAGSGLASDSDSFPFGLVIAVLVLLGGAGTTFLTVRQSRR